MNRSDFDKVIQAIRDEEELEGEPSPAFLSRIERVGIIKALRFTVVATKKGIEDRITQLFSEDIK